LAERRKQLEELWPIRDALKDEITAERQRIEEVVKEGDEFVLNMKVSLANLGVKPQFIEAADDDVIRQVALAASYVNGYDYGIDPALFPELV
jgi:hypothetical protein